MRESTIADIARMAGVGKATVSRVLNGTGYVSEETRQKVETVIKETKYRPSAAAQNLSKQATNIVGIIIPEAHNPFFAEVLAGISNVADEHDMVLFFCNTDNNAEKDVRALEMMFKQRVTGLIMTPAQDYSSEGVGAGVRRRLAQLSELGTAVVLLDRPIQSFRCDGVYSDNLEGAFMGVECLIKAGHEKIGLVAGDTNMFIGQQRLEGYYKAMREYGLPVEEKFILPGNFATKTTYDLTRQLLAGDDLPTAFFCSNNLSSIGFLRAVYERGMEVPRDMAYVGFDRVDALEIIGEKYTYLSRDVAEMGRAAMNLLLRRVEAPGKPVEQQILLPSLRVHGSEQFIPKK